MAHHVTAHSLRAQQQMEGTRAATCTPPPPAPPPPSPPPAPARTQELAARYAGCLLLSITTPPEQSAAISAAVLRDICPSAHQVRVLMDGGRCSTAGNLSHAKRLERRATAYREVSKGGGWGAPGHLPKCTRCATLRAGVHTHIHTQPHTHRLSLSHTHTIARAQVYTAGGAASWELPRAAAPLSAVTAALRRLRTDAGG